MKTSGLDQTGVTHSFWDILSQNLGSSAGYNPRQVRCHGRIQTQGLVEHCKHVGELVDGVDINLVNGLERGADFLGHPLEDLWVLREEVGYAAEGSCCCFRAGAVDTC